jgi:hypothetical protein
MSLSTTPHAISSQCLICTDALHNETTSLGVVGCNDVQFHFDCVQRWANITKLVAGDGAATRRVTVVSKLTQSIPEGYLEEDHPPGFVRFVQRLWNQHEVLATEEEKATLDENLERRRDAAEHSSADVLSSLRQKPLDQWTGLDLNQYMYLYRPEMVYSDLILFIGHATHAHVLYYAPDRHSSHDISAHPGASLFSLSCTLLWQVMGQLRWTSWPPPNT